MVGVGQNGRTLTNPDAISLTQANKRSIIFLLRGDIRLADQYDCDIIIVAVPVVCVRRFASPPKQGDADWHTTGFVFFRQSARPVRKKDREGLERERLSARNEEKLEKDRTLKKIQSVKVSKVSNVIITGEQVITNMNLFGRFALGATI